MKTLLNSRQDSPTKRKWRAPLSLLVLLVVFAVGAKYYFSLALHPIVAQVVAVPLIALVALRFSAEALLPHRRFKVVRAILKLIIGPLELLIRFRFYYFAVSTATWTLIFTFALPLAIWSSLTANGLLPQLPQAAVGYAMMLVSSLLFTYFGGPLTTALFWPIAEEVGRAEKLPWLRASIVRVYVFATMALAYMVANIEAFAGVVLISDQWWLDYKAVLLQVLVTYVAIDRVVVGYRAAVSSGSDYTR